MKEEPFQNALRVKHSPIHGFGVFAEKDFEPGETIEKSYLIMYDYDDTPHLDNLQDFVFKIDQSSMLPLGNGCIYNHSDEPNAEYFYDPDEKKILTFAAKKPIAKGEEIFISYGKKWFSCRDIKTKKKAWWRRLSNPRTSPVLRALIVIGAYYLIINTFKYYMLASN